VARPPIRLGDLAAELGLAVEGDPEVELSGVAPLDSAGPGDLSFIRSPAFAEALAGSRAGALVALPGLDVGGRPTLRADDPSREFYRAARLIAPDPVVPPGVHPSATLAEGACVDPSASVGAGCAIGRRAVVGARSVLHPGVVLYDDVRVGADCTLHARCVVAAASVLGDRVILQPGVVIGGEGFGYTGDESGGRRKVHNVGRVIVEDDVEIGANSTVDRGTLGDTRIGRGAKIDNLVMIAHNCEIGADALIAAQVGISGSTRVGPGAVLLGQAGFVGHLTVGPGAVVGAGSGVRRDVPPGAKVLGYPAREGSEFHREQAALRRLPKLLRRVRALERRLGVEPGEE
jgi:UDP-3-O-[3-hydroxymyristoyl] glucosamine N-acyltransferase